MEAAVPVDFRERIATRWDPPVLPDNPLGLNPESTLAREYAALRQDHTERLTWEPPTLRAMRDQMEFLRGIIEDDDSSYADIREARRQLRALERDLESAEQHWHDKRQARLQASLQAGEKWQQRWEHYLHLRRNLLEASSAAWNEEQHGAVSHSGRDSRARLTRDVEALIGSVAWYRARALEVADAVA